MKKKLLFAAGAMIIAAALSAAVCLNTGQTRHDDLFEQNLDALARGEGSVGRLGHHYEKCGALIMKFGTHPTNCTNLIRVCDFVNENDCVPTTCTNH